MLTVEKVRELKPKDLDWTLLEQELETMELLLTQGWCQETFARDAQGHVVDRFSSAAIAWCLQGACQRGAYEVTNMRTPQEVGPFLRLEHMIEALLHHQLLVPIARWNDAEGRTQTEVLAVIADLRRVVAHAMEEEL
jgi:hypothetical protein